MVTGHLLSDNGHSVVQGEEGFCDTRCPCSARSVVSTQHRKLPAAETSGGPQIWEVLGGRSLERTRQPALSHAIGKRGTGREAEIIHVSDSNKDGGGVRGSAGPEKSKASRGIIGSLSQLDHVMEVHPCFLDLDCPPSKRTVKHWAPAS